MWGVTSCPYFSFKATVHTNERFYVNADPRAVSNLHIILSSIENKYELKFPGYSFLITLNGAWSMQKHIKYSSSAELATIIMN